MCAVLGVVSLFLGVMVAMPATAAASDCGNWKDWVGNSPDPSEYGVVTDSGGQITVDPSRAAVWGDAWAKYWGGIALCAGGHPQNTAVCLKNQGAVLAGNIGTYAYIDDAGRIVVNYAAAVQDAHAVTGCAIVI